MFLKTRRTLIGFMQKSCEGEAGAAIVIAVFDISIGLARRYFWPCCSSFFELVKLNQVMKQKNLLLLLALALVGGCATVTPAVPDDYKGPVVSLSDSVLRETTSKGIIFALSAIDGNSVHNARFETERATRARRPTLTGRPERILVMRDVSRDVPVKPMKVTLVGTHVTEAPIQAIASNMAGTFFSVEGVVDFKPVEGKKYLVTGALAKEQSCVWIADAETKQPVTAKICGK